MGEVLGEFDDNSINSTSTAEIEKEKKELEMREVDEEARGRIANVVRSIELLKCDVGAMGEV